MPRDPQRLRVLVTNATRNSGLATLRALAGAGVEVVAADDRRLPLGMRSRHCHAFRTHPPEGEACVDGLLQIVQETRPDVLLPVGSKLTRLVARHRARLEPHVALLLPEEAALAAAFDNAETLRACARLGIAAPALLGRDQAFARLEAGEVVVVKPRPDVGLAQGVRYVRRAADLDAALRACAERFGEPLVVEYVPGGEDAMRSVNLLFDRESRLVAHFICHKLRQFPPAGGVTALGVSSDEHRLVEQVAPLFAAWRWRGGAEVELKLDSRDGVARVIEVNPRFSGLIGFPVACGLNLPLLACRAAAGLDAGTPGAAAPRGYRAGRPFRNSGALLRTLAAPGRSPGERARIVAEALLTLGAVPASTRDVTDPLPALGKILFELGGVLGLRADPPAVPERLEPSEGSGS
jgi:predicted ATP-grasp superfamily ATP-dependent carboligase